MMFLNDGNARNTAEFMSAVCKGRSDDGEECKRYISVEMCMYTSHAKYI